MIHVIALLTAHPGKREAVLEAFKENMPAVRAELGCLEYQPVIDMAGAGPFQAPIGEDTFMVLERWESQEALMAHAVAPHMKEYGRKVKDLLASRTIHVLTPAA